MDKKEISLERKQYLKKIKKKKISYFINANIYISRLFGFMGIFSK